MKKFLKEIVNLKKKEVAASKLQVPITRFVHSGRLAKRTRSFSDAISARGRMNLIAEIKKKSPSQKKGFLKKFNVGHLAELYAKSGAAAISVLTDKRFFGGDISHIEAARSKANLPVLRKDFIIDEYQVYESRYFGADAILLIARILSKEEIRSFMHLAKKIGMDSLVEVHDEKDLEKALVADARIIGINNRDLDTLTVDIKSTLKLVPKIPHQMLKVSESGIKTSKDISTLKSIGVNAVLIGQAFLEARDIHAKVREIMGGE